MKNSLFIFPHLGMGDAILVNGMVRELAAHHSLITFPSKIHNEPSVFWMFSDLHNVRVVPVVDDREAAILCRRNEGRGTKVMRLGLHGMQGKKFLRDEKHFDAVFYDQAGMNFEIRWSKFKVPERLTGFGPFIDCGKAFVVDDPSRGFVIDAARIDGFIFRPHKTVTIFDWLDTIREASSIHCIDSAFMCWIDSMPEDGKPLFWHRYARRNADPRLHPTLRRPWNILD